MMQQTTTEDYITNHLQFTPNDVGAIKTAAPPDAPKNI
jgi:hypothetical protein